jgi:hypothetical protein
MYTRLLPLTVCVLQVRSELAPWEKKIGEVSGRISVSTSERDVLARKVEGQLQGWLHQ